VVDMREEQLQEMARGIMENDGSDVLESLYEDQDNEEKTMNDSELVAILGQLQRQAIGYFTDEISEEQIRALKYYYREPFGDEQEGKSSVVDGTVAIVIDNALSSTLKPFVSSDNVVSFQPRGPEDIELADQATEYVNYVLNCDNPGFTIMHDWFKDALLTKLGIVKVWWEDISEDKVEVIERIDAAQVEMLMQSGDVVEGPYQDEDGLFAVAVKKSYEDGRVRIENVPPEEFLVSPSARNLKDAIYVAHRTIKSRTELIELGFDEEVVNSLSEGTRDNDWDMRAQVRYADESYGETYQQSADETTSPIIVFDEYVYVDYNQDGKAELRRIVRSGDTVLMNEEVDCRPFATLCPVPMPHKLYGMSAVIR